MYLIGTDVGTTGTKTVITDENGTVYGKGYREYELHAGPGGKVEQDAADWWDAVVFSVRAALQTVPDREKVAAMALSTQGGSTLAVDSDFEPISPAYTWMDARAAEESRTGSGIWGIDLQDLGLALRRFLRSSENALACLP